MITPAILNLKAVVGRTFDLTLVVFPEQPPLRWREPVLWEPVKYKVHDVVVGGDGLAYQCAIENHGINPVGDATGTWVHLPPEDITGWAATGHVNSVAISSPTSGIALGGVLGTVRAELKPEQSSSFVAGEHAWDLSLIDAQGHDYEYAKGLVKWTLPGELEEP